MSGRQGGRVSRIVCFSMGTVTTIILTIAASITVAAERLSFRGLELGASLEEVLAWEKAQPMTAELKERTFFRCDSRDQSPSNIPMHAWESFPSIDYKREYEDGVSACGFRRYLGFGYHHPTWLPGGVPFVGTTAIPRFYFFDSDNKKKLFRIVLAVESSHLAQVIEAYSLKYGLQEAGEPRRIFPFLDALKTPLAAWKDGKQELIVHKGYFHGDTCSYNSDLRGRRWESHCSEGLVTLVDRDIQELILSKRKQRVEGKEREAAEKKKRALKDI